MSFFVAVRGGFLTGAPRKHEKQNADPASVDIHYAKPYDTWFDADDAGRASGWKWWAIVGNSDEIFERA